MSNIISNNNKKKQTLFCINLSKDRKLSKKYKIIRLLNCLVKITKKKLL